MASSSAPSKFRVAIVGGGIGGLTAALTLAKYPDIDVTIYEAAAVFSEVGAGVGVWPRIWKTLAKLGLAEDMAKATHLKPKDGKVDTFLFRKSDQENGHQYYKLETDGSFLTYHRPDMQKVLIQHLPPSVHVHYKKRLASYKQAPPSTPSSLNSQLRSSTPSSGPVHLTFEDGTTATTDLLIGADGVKSAVRRCMLHEQAERALEYGKPGEADSLLSAIEPRWTGIVAYRALVPVERLEAYKQTEKGKNVRVPEKDSLPTMYQGQHINVVVYPISVGKMINVGAFHSRPDLAGTKFPGPWVSRVTETDLIKAHEGWEPELRAILDCVEKPLRWAIHASVPLDDWVFGNVVLLGDAAHAMSPQQASGGGQAIEDAYVLATLLGHRLTTKSTLARALSIYDFIRRPVANEVARRSLMNGSLFGLQLPDVKPIQAIPDSQPSLLGMGPDTTGSVTPIDFSHPVDFSRVVDFTKPENQSRLPENGAAIRENWRWAWETTLDRDVERAVSRLERQAEMSMGVEERAHL